MPLQFCNVPLASPFKFYPNTSTPNPGFDGDWAFNQILEFEKKVMYYQKWQIGDSTPFQMNSTIPPLDLKAYDCSGAVVKSFAWVQKALSNGIGIYETIVSFDDLNNKTVYLYFETTLLETSFKWVSEPISIRTVWPLTKQFKYYNRDNDQDIVFSTGYKPVFRCEAGIMEANFLSEGADFVDEIHDTTLLSATPYREFKLYVGRAAGVAPWVVDLLNRIYCCSHVEYRGYWYAKVSGAKWEIARQKGYPLIGASLDITDAKNLFSNQQNANSIEPGIITGYLFSPFFGTSNEQIPIKEIETIN